MRVWDLIILSKAFTLYNDPYGYYIITNVENEKEMQEIV